MNPDRLLQYFDQISEAPDAIPRLRRFVLDLAVRGKPGLNLDNIRMLKVPLPPLAEQHRIVAKVDELMALCDELEARLTTASATRRQLLEATLHEALAGGQ
jgi:restriction endonuclease S subunit